MISIEGMRVISTCVDNQFIWIFGKQGIYTTFYEYVQYGSLYHTRGINHCCISLYKSRLYHHPLGMLSTSVNHPFQNEPPIACVVCLFKGLTSRWGFTVSCFTTILRCLPADFVIPNIFKHSSLSFQITL